MSILDMVQSVYDSGVYLLGNYGWYLLIGVVILSYVYNKYVGPVLAKYRKYQFEKEYEAKYKNPDLFSAHVSAQQDFVQKLQEKYNQVSQRHEEKVKERQEQKRQELAEKYGPPGHVLGDDKQDKNHTKKTSLKPEYNPLMGSGSGSTYRPPRRSPCSGGGCGR